MVYAGRDLKDHIVPSPCHAREGHLPLEGRGERLGRGAESRQGPALCLQMQSSSLVLDGLPAQCLGDGDVCLCRLTAALLHFSTVVS